MPAEMLVLFSQTGNVRKGAIIAVKPEGWQWGTEELGDRFVRVRVTDAEPADLEPYLGDYRIGPEGSKELANSRLYYLDAVAVDSISVEPGRVLVTNKASVDNVMRNIIDNG